MDNENRLEEQEETDQYLLCCVCGNEHEKSITHGFEVKGKKKYICKECADAVHGLM
jgi:transposase-like protein